MKTEPQHLFNRDHVKFALAIQDSLTLSEVKDRGMWWLSVADMFNGRDGLYDSIADLVPRVLRAVIEHNAVGVLYELSEAIALEFMTTNGDVSDGFLDTLTEKWRTDREPMR